MGYRVREIIPYNASRQGLELRGLSISFTRARFVISNKSGLLIQSNRRERISGCGSRAWFTVEGVVQLNFIILLQCVKGWEFL